MKYLYFLASLCLLTACQSKPSSSETILPSGNKLTNHTSKKGQVAGIGDEVEIVVDFRIDTTILESTRKAPTPFKVVIPENQDAAAISPVFQLIFDAATMMGVGDSVTIERALDSLPANMVPPGEQFKDSKYLSLDIVLKSLRTKADVDAEKAVFEAEAKKIDTETKGILEKYLANSLGADLKTTPTGLKYYVIEEGSGEQLKDGDQTSVHYYGMTTDGNMFDNSFSRGLPYPVTIGQSQVIAGWHIGLAELKMNSKAVLFIPGNLGYGERGSPPNIGPNAELVFYVQPLPVTE